MYDHNYFSEPPHEEKANLIQTAQGSSGRGDVQPHTDLSAIHKASPRASWDPTGTQPLSSTVFNRNLTPCNYRKTQEKGNPLQKIVSKRNKAVIRECKFTKATKCTDGLTPFPTRCE